MYWTVVFSQERANNILWSQKVMDVDARMSFFSAFEYTCLFVAYCDLTATNPTKSLLSVALVD